MEAGICRNALIVGAEVLSKLVDWNDRGTCILFGDGAVQIHRKLLHILSETLCNPLDNTVIGLMQYEQIHIPSSMSELLAGLFNHVMGMEAKAVITEEFNDITNNDMHITARYSSPA